MKYEDCGHGRHEGAYCHSCEMEKILDLESNYGLESIEAVCVHGLPLDKYCGCCDMEAGPGKKLGGSSDYYDLPPDCTRLHDIIVKRDMHWSQANIFKAAYRWDIKPDLEYNLRKIIWFAEEELSRINPSSPARNVEGKED